MEQTISLITQKISLKYTQFKLVAKSVFVKRFLIKEIRFQFWF
jgi:hypothetical protein